MSDFDRIATGARHRDAAREALFTAPGGGLALACQRCGAHVSASAATLLWALRPPVLLLPWPRHPLWGRCPACRRRAWLAVRCRPTAGARSATGG